MGTGTIWSGDKTYRSYDEAATYVHRLGLESKTGWQAYCRGERLGLPVKPADIPASPWHVYGNEFSKQGGWGA